MVTYISGSLLRLRFRFPELVFPIFDWRLLGWSGLSAGFVHRRQGHFEEFVVVG